MNRIDRLRARYKQDRERISVLMKANNRRRAEIVAACPFQVDDLYPGEHGLELVLRVRFIHQHREFSGIHRDYWAIETLAGCTHYLPIPNYDFQN